MRIPARRLFHRVLRRLMALTGGPAVATVAMTSALRGQLRVDTLAFHSAALGQMRKIEVFLPLGYSLSEVRYPVLYLNDGQDSDSLDLAGTLARLESTDSLPRIIVVAMNCSADRIREYGTAGTPNAQGFGDKAIEYQRFVLDEVMPYIEREYPAATGPGSTGIMGLSLGGLSAFDLAWRHPERFGRVAVLSGSFWWRTDDSSPKAKQISRIMHRRVRETTGRPPLRMWFESGLKDETADRDGNGTIDAIQDTEELLRELAGKGFVRERDMVHVLAEGGHDLGTWRVMLPRLLVWLWGGPVEGMSNGQ